MREDHRAPTRIVLDGQAHPLTSSTLRSQAADWSRRKTLGRRWRTAFGAAMIAFGAWTLWHGAQAALAPPPPPIAANWNVELTSAGSSPVTALAFGPKAGLHFVTVPGVNANAEERRRIPARIRSGNLYLVSLGWSPLNVHTVSPPGAPRMAFYAQARFVQIFSTSNGTGISTTWRH